MRDDLGVDRYIQIVKRRLPYLIIPFVVISLCTLMVSLLLPNVYRSSTLILVEPQKVPEEYVKSTVTGSIEDRLSTIQQQILSRTLLQKIVDEFGLYRKESKNKAPEEVIELMRKHITVKVENTRQMNVDAFSVGFEGKDPKTVWLVTAKLASLFIEENLKVREEQAVSTSEFMESELISAKKTAGEQEDKIASYKVKYIGELPQQLDTNLRTLDRMQSDLTAITEAIKVNEDRKSAIEKLVMEARVRGSTVGDSGAPGPADVGDLKARLAALQAEYKDNYPDIILLKKQIEELESKQKSEMSEMSAGEEGEEIPAMFSGDAFVRNLASQLMSVNRDIRSLKDREKNLNVSVRNYERRVENTPAREQELVVLLRDYDNFSRNYQLLLDKKLNAKISENLERRQKGEQFRILDPAYLPQKPSSPKRWMINLLGMALGLGVGIGLVVLREIADDSIRGDDQIERELQLGVIASVPHFAMAGPLPSRGAVAGPLRRLLPWRKDAP